MQEAEYIVLLTKTFVFDLLFVNIATMFKLLVILFIM